VDLKLRRQRTPESFLGFRCVVGGGGAIELALQSVTSDIQRREYNEIRCDDATWKYLIKAWVYLIPAILYYFTNFSASRYCTVHNFLSAAG
jgi:hypothetical protein